MKKHLVLIGITFLTLVLRLWQLGSLPGTFFVDEVLIGYVGRFILENGVDLYGNHWPLLYFNNFGDYYIIWPMYLAGLATKFLGASEFAVRLPTVLFGTVAVPGIYWLARNFHLDRKTSTIAALLLAISPWHIVLSRSSTEGVIEVTLIILAVSLLLNAVRKQHYRDLFFAALFSLSSYFIYHSSRLQIPLIWLGMVAYQWFTTIKIKGSKKFLIITSVFAMFFLALTLFISQTNWGRGRFDQTSIFGEQARVVGRMTELSYNLGPDHLLLARIFHNKYLGYGREFMRQYGSYFAPDFLLLDGWKGTRYDVPEAGPNFLLIAPLMLIGAYFVFSQPKRLTQQWLIIWLLLIAPIPASMTVIESPNIRRSLLMVVPLLLLAAIGLRESVQMLNKHKLHFVKLILWMAIFAEFVFFWHHYVFQSDRVASLEREDGIREIVAFISQEENQDRTIYLPSRGFLPAQYLFFNNIYDPILAGKFGSSTHLDEYRNLRFIDANRVTGAIPREEVNPNDLVIDMYTCDIHSGLDMNYKLVEQIHGINETVMKYPVFQPNWISN